MTFREMNLRVFRGEPLFEGLELKLAEMFGS